MTAIQMVRHRVEVSVLGNRGVKSGIEDCDLRRRLAEDLPQRPNSAQVVGIMERRQVDAVFDSLQHLIVDDDRFLEQLAAMHHAVSHRVDVSQTANLVDPGAIRCQPAQHIIECCRDIADGRGQLLPDTCAVLTVMIASPPIRSTCPRHKSSSLSCLIRSRSVAITWNFRLELPALMTKTFIGSFDSAGKRQAAVTMKFTDISRPILYFRMRDCKVVRFRPSRAAAPFGPPTIPLASFNACRIRARSAASEIFEARAVQPHRADLANQLRHSDVELRPVAQNHRPLYDVLQFANIAGPIVIRERLQRLRWNSFDFPAHPLRMFLDEVASEQGDVLTPLPQGRNVQRKDVQPVVQVRPEPVLIDHRLQVPIGCGDEPDVRPDSAIAADTLELLVLDSAEQLRLEFERHFADLVEKERTSMRQFEASDLLRHRSGERALLVPE